MALTEKQRAAIRSQVKKNIAKRAATQRTKVSPSEARTVSSRMNKRPGATPSFILEDKSILSKNERDTLGATSKANAAKEKMMQKNRNFAKGTGKLPVKDRVGTKAEYKQLGKDIEMRKQLIARSKAARAAQAARAANPKPATPTPAAKTVAKNTAKYAPKGSKTVIDTPVTKGGPLEKRLLADKAAAEKPTTTTKPKASTAAVKKRTSPNTNPKTSKPRKPQTKATEPRRLQTLEQAKASAPKPRGPMLGPEKPTTTLTKPEGKVASKVGSTKVGSTVKRAANTTAGKSITGAAKKIGSNKLVKVGGKLVKVAAVVGVGRELAQIGSGQAEKDFRRIQALENRIAAAKGQKPKYTRSGTNRNLGESLKVDAANALSFVGLGKSRKARLTELKSMAAKAEKNKLIKPALKPTAGKKPSVVVKGGSAPAATSGNKYIVKKGDTLSAIASRSGVSLKDIRDANPKFAAQAKYKNGNMIFSGTSVTIPKKKAK